MTNVPLGSKQSLFPIWTDYIPWSWHRWISKCTVHILGESTQCMYLAKDSEQEYIKNSYTLIIKTTWWEKKKSGTSQKILEWSKAYEKVIDIISKLWHKNFKTMTQHYTAIRMAKRQMMPSIVEDIEQLEFLYFAAENAQQCNYFGNHCLTISELWVCLPYDPAIPRLSIYPREMKAFIYTDVYRNVQGSLCIRAKTIKNSNVHQLWYIHTIY